MNISSLFEQKHWLYCNRPVDPSIRLCVNPSVGFTGIGTSLSLLTKGVHIYDNCWLWCVGKNESFRFLILLDFLLALKAATLIFISGCG